MEFASLTLTLTLALTCVVSECQQAKNEAMLANMDTDNNGLVEKDEFVRLSPPSHLPHLTLTPIQYDATDPNPVQGPHSTNYSRRLGGIAGKVDLCWVRWQLFAALSLVN